MLRPRLFAPILTAALAAVSGRAASGEGHPGFRTLDVGGSRPAWYHPPAATERRPLTVFLHGMCALPEWECPVFQAATSASWLLCPPGPAACEGGGAMWVGKSQTLEKRIDRSVELLALREPGAVDLDRRLLVGYSLGAPAALRVALGQPGRYSRMMIVNAGTEPTAAQLKRAGVVRIALVAGERDATAPKLKRAAKRLAAAGVEARFFSLGKVGHYFDASSARRMTEALDWTLSEWR